MAQYAQRKNDSATISLEVTIILWKPPCVLQIWLK